MRQSRDEGSDSEVDADPADVDSDDDNAENDVRVTNACPVLGRGALRIDVACWCVHALNVVFARQI